MNDPAFALERAIDQYKACLPTTRRHHMRLVVKAQGRASDERDDMIRKLRRADHNMDALQARHKGRRATEGDDQAYSAYCDILAQYEATQRVIDQAWDLIWTERIDREGSPRDDMARDEGPLQEDAPEGLALDQRAGVPERRRRLARGDGMEQLPHLGLAEESAGVSGPDGMAR